MSTWTENFNPTSYGFLARVRPVLLATLSPALALFVWTGGLDDWVRAALSLVLVAGVPYVLGERAADAGRRGQLALWASWGGPPTVQLLRHRQDRINSHTHRRLRSRVAVLCGDLDLPTEKEEREDPDGADELYRSCSDRLRVLFRDHPMVLKANIAYGFRRNLRAIRGWGITGGVLALSATIIHGYFFGPTPLAVTTAVVSALVLIAFSRATGTWVKEPAFLYAHRLLEAVELEGDR